MSEQITVSFPGLGIGEFDLRSVAFTLFGKLEVRWYGLLITFGMAFAFFYVMWRAKKNEGIKPDDVMDTGLVCIVLAIIGARLYYVLTSLENYHSFYDVIAIWNGGLAFYGGVIGGGLGIFIMSRIKKFKLLRFYDAVVPALALAQAIGRWGNFFNGEAYGYQITEAGTSRYFFFLREFSVPAGSGTLFHWLRMGLSPNVFSYDLAYVHPTFLYESVWNLLGFLLLTLLYRKKKFNGQIFLSYLVWYGFGRMFIEGLRSDSLYIFKGIFGTDGIRISQLIGLLCVLAGTAALIAISVYRRKNPEFLSAKLPKPAPVDGEPVSVIELPKPEPEPEEPKEPEPLEEVPLLEDIPEEAVDQWPAEDDEDDEGEAPEEAEPEAEVSEEPEEKSDEPEDEPEEKAEEPAPKPAPRPRRKPPVNQRGAVSLPGKKKKPAKKTPVAQRGKDHADH